MDVGLFYGVSGIDVSNRCDALQIFVTTHPMIQCHIPGDLNLQQYNCEKFTQDTELI